MSNYTTLSEMGVQNPDQIQRYAMYTVHNTDILQLFYTRQKGSILPVTRKYRFECIKKSTLVDSGTRQTEVLYESSPTFRNAVAELDELLAARASKQDLRALIGEEVRLLEEDVATRIAYIRRLVEKI